jgi:hypothetical protein
LFSPGARGDFADSDESYRHLRRIRSAGPSEIAPDVGDFLHSSALLNETRIIGHYRKRGFFFLVSSLQPYHFAALCKKVRGIHMNSKALLLTSSLRRACTLGIVLSVAILATNAEALPEPKVTITYSLETADGGAYRQIIADTPLNLGNANYVVDVLDSGDPNVTVHVDNPLRVTLEFTADSPGGNIVDGPVEITDTHFEREFDIDSGLTLANTVLSTVLSRVGTGTLSGSTITWDNVVGVNAYQEDVVGWGKCTPESFCNLAGTWPRDLSGINEVPLPTFTVLTNCTFGDAFVSDNGTPGDRSDDIDRPDPYATVTDLWEGVAVPEPNRETLLLAGALGLAGLSRLRERGGASA